MNFNIRDKKHRLSVASAASRSLGASRPTY